MLGVEAGAKVELAVENFPGVKPTMLAFTVKLRYGTLSANTARHITTKGSFDEQLKGVLIAAQGQAQ